MRRDFALVDLVNDTMFDRSSIASQHRKGVARHGIS